MYFDPYQWPLCPKVHLLLLFGDDREVVKVDLYLIDTGDILGTKCARLCKDRANNIGF